MIVELWKKKVKACDADGISIEEAVEFTGQLGQRKIPVVPQILLCCITYPSGPT